MEAERVDILIEMGSARHDEGGRPTKVSTARPASDSHRSDQTHRTPLEGRRK